MHLNLISSALAFSVKGLWTKQRKLMLARNRLFPLTVISFFVLANRIADSGTFRGQSQTQTLLAGFFLLKTRLKFCRKLQQRRLCLWLKI